MQDASGMIGRTEAPRMTSLIFPTTYVPFSTGLAYDDDVFGSPRLNEYFYFLRESLHYINEKAALAP